MAYLVSQPDIADIGPVLVKLWSDNLHMRTAPVGKYEWFYRDNPLGPATAFMLESQTDAGAEIVGSCGIGPRRIYVGDKPFRAGLLADFTVDKTHRTVLPALMLQRAVADYGRTHFDITYAYPNDAAIGIFKRIGYDVIGQAGRYVRILSTKGYVPRIVRTPLIAGAASALADVGLGMFDAVRPLHRGRALTVEWVDRLDDRFDRLFDHVRSLYRLIGDRSAAFLQWRFIERPGVNGRIATLVDSQGELRAYAAITDREPGAALLADFLSLTYTDLGILLERLMRPLRAAGYKTLLTTFLGDPAAVKVLTAQGFRYRKTSKFIVMGIGSTQAMDRTELHNARGWYLTEADRDN